MEPGAGVMGWFRAWTGQLIVRLFLLPSASCVPTLPLLLPLLMHSGAFGGKKKVDKRDELCIRN